MLCGCSLIHLLMRYSFIMPSICDMVRALVLPLIIRRTEAQVHEAGKHKAGVYLPGSQRPPKTVVLIYLQSSPQ